MNLRNVEKINDQLIKVIKKPEPTILRAEYNKENIAAYLSDTRIIIFISVLIFIR